MLTHVLEHLVFRIRSQATVDFLHVLAAKRASGARAKKCRVESDLLVIVTNSGKDLRFSSGEILAQLERIDCNSAVPVLADLLICYDSSGMAASRAIWRHAFSPKTPVLVFHFSTKPWLASTLSHSSVTLTPGFKKTARVVKMKSGALKYELRPSEKLREVFLDALRKMMA